MNRIDLNKNVLEKLYLKQKWSGTRIAKKFNVCSSTVYENLRRCNIPIRDYKEACGRLVEPSFMKQNISKEGRYYVAACLDCEGWISSNGRSSFKAGIGNNVKELLQKAQSLCGGGRLYPKKDGSWYLAFGMEDMRILFPQILSCLVIKGKKAEKVLEYIARRVK